MIHHTEQTLQKMRNTLYTKTNYAYWIWDKSLFINESDKTQEFAETVV